MVQSVSHENFTSVIKFKLSLVSDEGYKSSPRSMEVCVILSKLKNHNFSAETTGLKDFFTSWYMQCSRILPRQRLLTQTVRHYTYLRTITTHARECEIRVNYTKSVNSLM